MLFIFQIIYYVQTDRQTDGRTERRLQDLSIYIIEDAPKKKLIMLNFFN